MTLIGMGLAYLAALDRPRLRRTRVPPISPSTGDVGVTLDLHGRGRASHAASVRGLASPDPDRAESRSPRQDYIEALARQHCRDIAADDIVRLRGGRRRRRFRRRPARARLPPRHRSKSDPAARPWRLRGLCPNPVAGDGSERHAAGQTSSGARPSRPAQNSFVALRRAPAVSLSASSTSFACAITVFMSKAYFQQAAQAKLSRHHHRASSPARGWSTSARTSSPPTPIAAAAQYFRVQNPRRGVQATRAQ